MPENDLAVVKVFLTPPSFMKKPYVAYSPFFSNFVQPVTDRNGVNKQIHTRTLHTQRKITLEMMS